MSNMNPLMQQLSAQEPQQAGVGGGQFDWGNAFAQPMSQAAGQAAGQVAAVDPLAAAYLARNPDVAADSYWGARPLEHFQRYGQAEGRTWDAPAAAPAAAAAPAIPAYQPAEQTANIYGNTPDAWSHFKAQGQAQTEGINRMPGVFSNTGAVPADPAGANALLYKTGATGGNPLMEQLTQWISSTKG